MSHQALARKYRPRRFADVATQEHVSETLRRAVASDRVGHAYLFCGPRGVGKTTLARVLAMALNCPERSDDGEPCGECESCQRIWGGHTSLDVVEIDAATNRGVDDARDLRERAMYAPSDEERYKVYIVDEAHMLTREAWNALLKILEEPPPRVIFVFATTEPQKIQQSAAPILSRCQRFDFRRIGAADIVSRLTEVLENEGTRAPDEALRTIGRKADGGLRDALSLLDQVLALNSGEVSVESVRRVLGLVEDERYLALLDLLRERRHGQVFSFVDGLLDEGYDLVEFYHGLVEALRALLRLRLDPEDVPDLQAELRDEFLERAGAFDPGDLVRMLAMAAEMESSGSLRRSAQPRMLIELLLLRYSYLDRTVSLEELLRGMGSGGDPVPVDPTPGGRGTAGPREEGPVPSAEGAPPSTRSDGPGPGGAAGAEAPEAPADEPTPKGGAQPEPEPRPGPAESPQAALERALGEAGTIPSGMRPFLRAARVSEAGEGRLNIALPPGPGLERLQDPVARRLLAEAMGRHLTEVPELTPIPLGGEVSEAPTRITPDTVREDRLRELLEREPGLRQPVEELDLELLE